MSGTATDGDSKEDIVMNLLQNMSENQDETW